MRELIARIHRAWDRICAWVSARLHGARPYRHANEQANHTEQAAQTQTSIGLLALAATHSDDEHRLQALEIERVLISRQTQIERNRAERGLTPEEMGESASIQQQLDALHPPVATLAAVGPRRLADFGTVGGAVAGASPWGLILGVLGSPLSWIMIGLAAFGVQTARITHLHHDLDDARGAARQNAQAAHTWETRSHAYEQATADAQAAAHITTQTLEAERRRVAAAAAREQRRQREIANVNAGAEPPNWDSSLRGDSAPEDQPSPAAPAANSNPS